jgi:glutathione S-transferase
MVQVLTGSLVLRLKSLTKADVLPWNIWLAIEQKAPNFIKWAEAVTSHPSVTKIFDEKKNTEYARARIAKLRASA